MPKPDLHSKPEQILAPISQHPNETHDNKSQLRTYDGFLTSEIVIPTMESCSMPRREHLKFPYTLARTIKLKPSKVARCLDQNVSLLLRSWQCFFFNFISDVLRFLHWTISISSKEVSKEQAHWCQSLCKQFGQRGLVVRGCSTHTNRQMLYSYWGEVHAGIDRLGQYLPVFEKQRSLANPSYTDSELCLWFAQTIKARHFCID